MQASETRTVIEESGKDFVASCLDTGNPMWVMEDPQVTLEILGPYVVTTHVRDSVVFEHPRGAAAQWVALGDGVIDWNAFFTLYQKVCPKCAAATGNHYGPATADFAVLRKGLVEVVPEDARQRIRALSGSGEKGHPFMGSMVIEDSPGKKPAEFMDALKEQQRVDLERSIAFARRNRGSDAR